MKYYFLLLLVLVLAAGAVVATRSTNPLVAPLTTVPEGEHPARGPEFSPEERSLVYRIEQTAHSRIDPSRFIAADGPVAMQKGTVEHLARFSAHLHLRFLRKDSSRWEVAARFTDLHFTVDGIKPAFADALEEPFSFALRPNGAIDNFKHVPGLPEAAAEWIADVIREIQVILPETSKDEWTTRELKTNGAFRATYRLLHADPRPVLAKIVTSYEDRQKSTVFNRHIRTDVVLSESRIVVTEGWRHIESIDKREEINFLDGNSLAGSAAMSFRMHLMGDSSLSLPATIAELSAALADRKYLSSTFYRTDKNIDAQMRELDPASAMSIYARMLGASEEEALIYLRNYVQLYPHKSYEILSLAEHPAKNFDTITRLIAWRAVAEAGHPEAQQAIVDFFTDSGRSDGERMRAIAYLHSLSNPMASTVDDSLNFLRQGLNNPNLADEIKVMTIYAYGAFAKSPHIAAEVRETIHPNLASLAQQHLESDLLIPLIHAMGNHSGEEVVPALRQFSNDPDEQVRYAALESLAKTKGDDAFKAFTAAMDGERNSNVRIGAVRSLAEFSTHAQVNQWVTEQIGTAASSEERAAMIDVLGRGLQQHPLNEKKLRELLTTPLTNQEKKKIYQYIAP